MNFLSVIDGDTGNNFTSKVSVFIDDTPSIAKNKIFSLHPTLAPSLIRLELDNIPVSGDNFLYTFKFPAKELKFFNAIKEPSSDFSLFTDLTPEDSTLIFSSEMTGDKDFMIQTLTEKYKPLQKKLNFKKDNVISKLKFTNVISDKQIESITRKYQLKEEPDISQIFENFILNEKYPVLIYKPNIRKPSEVKIFKNLKDKAFKKLIVTSDLKIKSGRGLTIFRDDYSSIIIDGKLVTYKCPFDCPDLTVTALDLELSEPIESEVISSYLLQKEIDSFNLKEFSLFFTKKITDSSTINLVYTRASPPVAVSIKNNKIFMENENGIILFWLNLLFSNLEGTLMKKSKSKVFNKKLDTVSCQSIRQPVLSETEPPVSSPGKPSSYELIYKGSRYICKNEPYLYPGFTVRESPCCFKTPQKNKEIFIRITNPNEVRISPSNLPVEINGKVYLALRDNNDFFYLKEDANLEKITDPSIISKIKSSGDIWLEKVSLSKIKSLPSKSKCKNPPNNVLTRTCKNSKFPNFGYTISSEPCCFSKPRDLEPDRVDQQHVITTDKILNDSRLGVLPKILDFVLPNPFLRMGVIQNNKAFLNCVSKALNKSNVTDSLKISQNKFKRSPVSSFFDYQQFIEYLEKSWINHKLVVDLVQDTFKINVIVVNLENEKISCGNLNENEKYIIILKTGKFYELVVKKSEKVFDKKDIKKLLELYNFSCKVIKPDNFPLNLKELSSVLNLQGQIVNKAGYVNFVKYNNVLLPVYKSRSLELPEVEFIKTSPEKQIEILNKIKIPELKVKSQVASNGKIVALIVQSGLYIPVLESEIIEDLEIFNTSYYQNINEILQANEKVQLDRVKNVMSRIVFEEYLERLKYILSIKITDSLKEKIKEIKKSKLDRPLKFSKIKNLIWDLIDIGESQDSFFGIKFGLFRTVCSENCNKDFCDKNCKIVDLGLGKENVVKYLVQQILKNNDIINKKISDKSNFSFKRMDITLVDPKDIMIWFDQLN